MVRVDKAPLTTGASLLADHFFHDAKRVLAEDFSDRLVRVTPLE